MRIRARLILFLAFFTPYLCEADVSPSNKPEQHAVVDAAQAHATQELGKPVKLAIKKFSTEQQWAFVHATMLDPNGQAFSYAGTSYAADAEAGIKSTSYAALLQKTDDGTWRIVAERIGPTDMAWADWSKEYGAPATLFGTIPK
jgi:hypothetical protein